jgi:hypothetical protein
MTVPLQLRPPHSGDVLSRRHAREMTLRLMGPDWSHFATLTSAEPMSEQRLVRQFNNRFVRQAARLARGGVQFFYAIEHDRATGQFPHLHALLHGTSHLTTSELRAQWPFGLTHIAPYDRALAAAVYVTKGILVDPDGYDVSSTWPPLREGYDRADDERLLDALDARRPR